MFENNEDVLITVKAYPNPSKKYTETVCVAGIVPKKGWIRLYPVPFRSLPFSSRFKKYEIINFNIKKSNNDNRPESYGPNLAKIRRVDYIDTGTDRKWQKRKDIVLRFCDDSMCEIQTKQKEFGKSLGLFKPREIYDLEIEEFDPDKITDKTRVYSQMGMFDVQLQPLDQIPFSFRYHYCCSDKKCKGHRQIIIDWEIFELYRNVKKRHGDDAEAIKNDIKNKFITEIFSEKRDAYFYTGNMKLHPQSFIILGIFWPPK